jgi:hypothetical protein
MIYETRTILMTSIDKFFQSRQKYRQGHLLYYLHPSEFNLAMSIASSINKNLK